MNLSHLSRTSSLALALLVIFFLLGNTATSAYLPTFPLSLNWTFFSYRGGVDGYILNDTSILFLPYPASNTLVNGTLSGSDAQPDPNVPFNSTANGFGFTATFVGAPNDSSNFGDNMAVWLHSNATNYSEPEYGFTYRPETNYIYGYYQFGNGSSSSIYELYFPLILNNNASHTYEVTVHSSKIRNSIDWRNTFRWFVNRKLLVTETYTSFFEYAVPMYLHVATHMYSASNECGSCYVEVSDFYGVAIQS